MAGPLDGVRVLDMTIFQQGTYSTAMLADLGADVIKIEGPDSPDLGRWSAAVVTQKPLNSYFHSLNRSKRAICLDLKKEDGRRVFHKLVEEADVFVSNLRRPALKRLQADYETLSKINPSLVYGRASGYGPNGPDADLGSMDILGQARGGIMSMTGEPDRGPKPAGVAVGDHVGAMSMAFGLMVALFHRERTGEGQEVDASLLGGQMCIQTFNITDYLWSGKAARPHPARRPQPDLEHLQGQRRQVLLPRHEPRAAVAPHRRGPRQPGVDGGRALQDAGRPHRLPRRAVGEVRRALPHAAGRVLGKAVF